MADNSCIKVIICFYRVILNQYPDFLSLFVLQHLFFLKRYNLIQIDKEGVLSDWNSLAYD